ncbi:MAG: iron ABC transporter permease [Acetobacteraceae bacterium]
MPPWRQVWDPARLLWFVLVAVLALLVILPLVQLLLISVEIPGQMGGFTLANYVRAFSRERYLVGFKNSFILGASVATFCLALAVPMAWAVARTNMPAKQFVRLMVLLTFITPPFLGATSWVLLASPNAGWLNRAFTALTGAASGPLDIYSFPGLVFVIGLYSLPYAFVFATAALEMVSSEMEEAANILGAGRFTTTLRITLPLIMPAMLGAWIISFLEAVSIVGSAVIVGLPARINLVPLQLLQFFGFPLQVEVAAAYSMPLLLLTVVMFWLQRRLLSRRGYVALTGKGGARTPMDLGNGRWVALGFCLFVVTLSVILPYLVLSQAAFSSAWARGFRIDNLTLENFRQLLIRQTLLKQSIINTFTYSAAAATIAGTLALAAGYLIERRLVPLRGLLSSLCLAPFVVPGLVLAIGFYAAYAPPPLLLGGTAAILILAFTTRFLPIAFTNATAAVRGLNPEMEDAVRILGGNRITVLTRVVAPILKRNIAAVWLLVFIASSREVSSALFLYGPATRTMSVMFFDLTEGAQFEQLAALGLIMAVTTVLFVAIGQAIAGRDFMLRRN